MKLRKMRPIIIAACTLMLGASAGFTKYFNSIGHKELNGLGQSEVPELQGFGGVALLTAVGAVGYGARKVYQKIVSRNRQ